MAPSRTSRETATTSGCRYSPMQARSTEKSSLPWSASSPTWSQLRPEIPRLRRGRGSSSPRRSKAGGAWLGGPTPTRSWSMRHARRSPSCKRRKAPAAEPRPMGASPLSIDVYVAPMRPYTCPDQLGEGEVATWAPSSSTLISGPTEGILIDALLTFENADRIAAWAKSFGKTITGVFITHGHSDHWLGLASLLQHFPEVRGYAAPEVVKRAAWEAEVNKRSKYWTSRFPRELPGTPVAPEVLNTVQIRAHGRVAHLTHLGQGDMPGATF